MSQPLPEPFRRFSSATAVASLVLAALGGAVRATDSGLACPTWPGCFTAGDFVPPANLNVWLEHTHRLVAGLVALMIAGQLLWVLARFRDRAAILWATVAAAVLVIAQALLGAAVVWLQLRAELVTTHLGMAMALVALLIFLAVAATGASLRLTPFSKLTIAVAGLAYVQILLGGHASGVGTPRNYAVHAAVGLGLAAAIMTLAARARRAQMSGWSARLPRIAAWLVALQIGIGLANLASGLSFLAVIPHLAVATWIWAALVLEVLLTARVDVDVPARPYVTIGAAP